MIFVDGHVHIYDCFDLDTLLDAALRNLRRVATQLDVENGPVSFMLLLAEGRSSNWFQRIAGELRGVSEISSPAGCWDLTSTSEELALRATRRHEATVHHITLVAGRQIVTVERLEVLALFCATAIADGLPLRETVEAIQQAHGLVVIPWGAGKWTGERGRILQGFLPTQKNNRVFLGDNGGRPRFLPPPSLFAQAKLQNISILPGSDPLPLLHEAHRVGTFGFYLAHPPSENSPAGLVKDLLLSGKSPAHPFGDLQGGIRFMANQFQLRFFPQ